MAWTFERKTDACFRAPIGAAFHRPDTRVTERPGWYQIETPSTPGTWRNEVYVSRVRPDEAEDAIDRTVAAFRAHGHDTKWCVGPWTEPADFGERLARRGFSSWAARGMGCATSLAMPEAETIAVEEVGEADAETLDTYLHVGFRGWDTPTDQLEPERAIHLEELRRSPRRAHFFLARLGNAPIGTASVLVADDFGYLLGAQVLAEARGRGAYRALVGARLVLLRRLGLDYAVTHAREATSAPILERLGFETLFRYTCYLSPPV